MNMFNSVTNRAKVYKVKRWLGHCDCHPKTPDTPWIGKHPVLGTKSFATWREAYDHARTRLVTMNA